MKLSIITVVWNAVSTIEQTICSVLEQRCQADVEYLIIDGGSTDGTLEVIDRYRDRLARVVSEPDDGLYDAMNKGIRLATGDVIGIINADDYYLPGAFQTVEDALAGRALDRVIFWGDVQYEKLGRVKGFRPRQRRIGAFAPHPSMFCPKAVYERIGVYDTKLKLLADYDFMYRAVNYYRLQIVYCPVLIAFFREGGLADSNIRHCLLDELTVKLRYGQHRWWAVLLYRLKLLKNYFRIRRSEPERSKQKG